LLSRILVSRSCLQATFTKPINLSWLDVNRAKQILEEMRVGFKEDEHKVVLIAA
jgi:hypothetical protein